MRFGLIGFGGIGHVRKMALEQASNCSFTAVYDINKDITKQAGAGVYVFDSVEALADPMLVMPLLFQHHRTCILNRLLLAWKVGNMCL